MFDDAKSPPIDRLESPVDVSSVADIVRSCFESKTAVYPIGGGTSLDFGLPARRQGIGLSLADLNRVIDYPARDMTITVEAGITLEVLAGTLAKERQWLPVDAAQPEQATLGGVIACSASGPRRFGSGTMRDYVIGIHAVDGRGIPFKGGGRVVKNVAGYDFCKLLTGSLGTLGVITQVTLKIRPLPEKSVLLTGEVTDLAQADRILESLVNSVATPAAIELVSGPYWNTQLRLIVGLEGMEPEVNWMLTTLKEEWRGLGVSANETVSGEAASHLWRQLRDFAVDRDSPLVLKASIRPSAVCRFLQLVRECDPQASVQSHAGTGIVLVRFANFSAGDLSKQLIGRLQPLAQSVGGNCVVLSSVGLGELPRQVQWGGVTASNHWMTNVKRQFDPQDILNPGRFVYEDQ